MIREIKFRGKKADDGEWLYGDLMHDNIGGRYIYPINAENLYKENKVDSKTVGQFTGLYDKNGEMVYEGDIVHLDAWEPHAMQVKFIEGAFVLADNDGDGRYLGDIHYINHAGVNQCTILGNIHDNPKLLK